jgi:C4-dicarboxylate-specific signal transduction histidine kinase
MVDDVMVGQVLLNLVKNALDAMQQVPSGARRLLLKSAFLGENTLQVAVIDSGPGLAPDAQAHLFMPFFSTKPNGLGIGLNICRSLIELQGGALWYEPGAVGGSAFGFTLPVEHA